MAPKTVFRTVVLAMSLASATVAAAATEWLRPEDAFSLTAARTGDGVALSFEVTDGHYLYRDKVKVTAGTDAIPVDLPPGVAKDDPVFGAVEVYTAPFTVTLDEPSGSSRLTVHYQGCAEGGICFAPDSRTVDLASLEVGGRARGIPATASKPASIASEGYADLSSRPVVGPTRAPEPDGPVDRLLARGGVAAVAGGFVLFGVLLAFTPCVFPMFPILGGLLAREGESLEARRGFALSSTFVLAMASAFALLGIAAAWSGRNLQVTLQSPVAIGLVAMLFLALALSLFGAFELRLPEAWTRRVARTPSRRGTYGTAAVLGFTSALVVGPCVTAPLAGALLYIAQTGDVALGAGALFALGIGKGLPLVAFGTVGGKALPRTGAWMNAVRWLFGFVFLGAAVLLLGRIIDPAAALFLWGALAITAGVFLGAGGTASDAGPLARLRRAGGLVALVYGAVLLIGAGAGAVDPLRPLAPLSAASEVTPAGGGDLDFAVDADAPNLAALAPPAAAGGRPTLIYFTADWCITCAVIERTVLTDPTVKDALGGMRLVKADVSGDSPANRSLMASAGVFGPPTMVFLGPGGDEAGGTRLVGEVDADSLIAAIERVRETP